MKGKWKSFKIDNNSAKGLVIHVGMMLSIVVLVMILFAYVYLPSITNHNQTVTVPDIIGIKAEELDVFLAAKDLQFEIKDSIYSKNHPPFTVVKQYPKEGFLVKEGRKISVTLARQSPGIVKMPGLVNLSFKDAQLIAQNLGLVIDPPIYVPYPHHNLVLKQFANKKEIEEGSKVNQGQRIVLEVGDANHVMPFPVPNYVGMSIEEVKIAAKGQNIEINLLEEASEGPIGKVLKQRPESLPGKTIIQGETITVWHSVEK